VHKRSKTNRALVTETSLAALAPRARAVSPPPESHSDEAPLRQPVGFEIPALRSRAESGINLFVMKRLLLLFIISAAFPYALLASDSLPFPVSLGGQPAKDGTPFAKIENPVAADAELAVESKSDMIIVNVNMVTAKNEPVPGSTPAVILLQAKTKTNIDKTMDGKNLPSGNYIMSVVSEGKTASILFTIK
jgi:hypothetical protein